MFSVACSINTENYIHKISDVKPSSQVLDKLLNHDAFFIFCIFQEKEWLLGKRKNTSAGYLQTFQKRELYRWSILLHSEKCSDLYKEKSCDLGKEQ